MITGLNDCQGTEAAAMLNNAFGRNKASFFKGNVACIVNLEGEIFRYIFTVIVLCFIYFC